VIQPLRALSPVRHALGWRGAVFSLTFFAPPLRVEAEVFRDVACTGCVLATSGEADEARPLWLVLHGDEGTPTKVRSLWQPLADRGICGETVCGAGEVPSQTLRVLFVQCPRAAGCEGSFWRWGGEPSFLVEVAQEAERRYATPTGQRYVAGWSGGATYLGMSAEAIAPEFRGMLLVGGGAPSGGACSAKCTDVGLLLGDRNPLHGLALEMRDRLTECGHAVTTHLARGADHAGEWRAYARTLPSLVRESMVRPACSPSAPAHPAAAAAPPPTVATSSSSPPPSVVDLGPVPPPPTLVAPRPQGCGCTTSSSAPPPSAAWFLLFVWLNLARRSRISRILRRF
jgi:hypothetical protein